MSFEKQILSNIKLYFEGNTQSKWANKYEKGFENINHNETWLTLVSLYSLFGDQQNISSANAINAFKKILSISGFQTSIDIDNIEKVSLEKVLPEIVIYREYLYKLLEVGTLHLYPDRNKYLFIEAKYLSDIDTKTRYSPVRNQIIRNIDSTHRK